MLSFDELFTKVKAKALPSNYTLASPAVIKNKDFFEILSFFSASKDLLSFIEKICTTPGITVKSNHKSYNIHSLTDFFCFYAQNGFYKANLSKTHNEAVLSKLKEASLSKDQLLYLLKQLPADDVYYELIPAKCFKDEDLLAIVNSPAYLSTLSPEVISVLFNYFNPNDISSPSDTPFLDMYYFASRAGHVLGLEGSVSLTYKDVELSFDTEFEYASTSLEYLCDHIKTYSASHPDPHFKAIYEAFDHSLSQMGYCDNFYLIGSKTDFFERYAEKGLTYFSSGWYKHTVALALYGDYLVYVNRGEGSEENKGSRIFKLKDRILMTLKYLGRLLESKIETAADFHAILSEVIDLDNPVVTFNSQPQKYDTCSFVNPKGAIEGMLLLLQVGPFATVENVKAQFEANADRKEYKTFDRSMRSAEVDDLIDTMHSETHEALIAFFAALTKKIINAHHGRKGYSEKDKAETFRACHFYENLPDHVKEIVDQDDDFLDLVEEIQMWREEYLLDEGIEALRINPSPLLFQSNIPANSWPTIKTESTTQNINSASQIKVM